MPPAPSGDSISYGPSLVPALSNRSLAALGISLAGSRFAHARNRARLRPCRPRLAATEFRTVRVWCTKISPCFAGLYARLVRRPATLEGAPPKLRLGGI